MDRFVFFVTVVSSDVVLMLDHFKVVEDPGVPGTEDDLDEPVGCVLPLLSSKGWYVQYDED